MTAEPAPSTALAKSQLLSGATAGRLHGMSLPLLSRERKNPAPGGTNAGHATRLDLGGK
jgi:hypothetical protein